MILSPLQNTAWFSSVWIQKRPFITQIFGINPQTYEQFGLKGHNGTDLRCAIGTPIFASFDGQVKIGNDGAKSGYGKYIKMRGGDREITLGHLNSQEVTDGQFVKMGELIGYTGNTGFSTGPHLHITLKQIIPSDRNIWLWMVKNTDNGYNGAYDPAPYLLTFKGTLLNETL